MYKEDFIGLVVAVLMAFVGGMFIGSALQMDTDQKEAILRGYALYCPNDGKFAWVGECE